MELGRFLVEAVVLGGQSPNQLARTHPISRSWLFRLLARYKQGGPAAIEPRSHRPKACPHQISPVLEAAILELRRELSTAGFDAGPQTILHHLAERFQTVPSRTTVWRVLHRHRLITEQPHKRPKSSFITFVAELPNQMWQADSTHWLLADGSDVEILNLVDDHSRFCLASTAFRTVKAADALQTFFSAAESFGYPAKFLSDNAAVFSGKSRRGRVALESELDRLGVVSLHSTPYHPQTCGKSNAFTRPSRSSSLDRRRLSPSPTSSSSSTSFATATTSNDLTAPSMAALPSRPSMLGSKPRLRSRASLFNTASAATWSTLPVLSPSAL